MSKIKREQRYTFTLLGDIEVDTKGYNKEQVQDYTLVYNDLGKCIFMTESKNIVDVKTQAMPLFS